MKKIFSLFIIMVFCGSLFAQKAFIEKNKNYSLAKIYQKNYKILKVNNLKLINDSVITFKVVRASQTSELSVSDVKYVSVKKGTNALSYGLVGAGIGLFSVGITHLAYMPDPLYDDFNWAPMYIGFTVGCGAIGAFIGAFSYKWKRLYFQNNELISNVMFIPYFQKDTYVIGLILTF
jgi:hypothetical protein